MKLINNMNIKKIGIIGYGTVGETIAITLNRKQPDWKIMVYDKYKKHSIWSVNLDQLVQTADCIFICLPTAIKNLETGEPNISIIESSIKEIERAMAGVPWPGDYKLPIVIKSTIPPGTCQKLSKQSNNLDIFFTPEFLTEKNRFNDIEDGLAIIGAGPEATKDNLELIQGVLSVLHNKSGQNYLSCNIKQVSWEEAELVKYMHNSFLALKVAFAADFCKLAEKFNADYSKVKNLVVLGSRGRIADSHLNQPAVDGKYSYISSCFTKDILAAIYLFNNLDLTPFTIEAAHKNMMAYRGLAEALEKYGKTIYDPEEN